MDLLYEFALTPDIFGSHVVVDTATEKDLKEILKGLRVNGVVADLHKSRWKSEVINHRLPTLSQYTRDRVLHLLQFLDSRNRIVRHPRRLAGDPQNDHEWLALAIESHRRTAMRQIIAGADVCNACTESDVPLVELSEVLDSDLWQQRRTSRTVQKTIPAVTKALVPLLRHARSVSLIDPYLCPRAGRFIEIIKLVLRLAGARGHGQQMDCRIDIHAGDPSNDTDAGHSESVADRLIVWAATLNQIHVSPHRVRVFLWKNYNGGENLHDRFIITDQVGVSVPGGLDIKMTGTANSTTWTLLDFEDQQLWASRFDPAANVYELMTPAPLEVK